MRGYIVMLAVGIVAALIGVGVLAAGFSPQTHPLFFAISAGANHYVRYQFSVVTGGSVSGTRDSASRRRAAHRDRPRHRRKRIRDGRDGGPPRERRECGDPASRRGGEQPVDRAGAALVRVRRNGGPRGGVPQWPSRAAVRVRGTAGNGASHVADPMKGGSNRRRPSSHSLL